MKPTALILASIATALALAGCNLNTQYDDLIDPGTLYPPLCSVGISLYSAMVTSSRGGYVDLNVTISNSAQCAPAYNIHADIVARQSGNWVGETSADFDGLNGGESTGGTVEIPVTGLPDDAYCTLTWNDDAGKNYMTVVRSNLYSGGLYLSRAVKSGSPAAR